MLPKIPGEPDWANPVVRCGETANDLIAAARAAIPYEEHLCNAERAPSGGHGCPRQRLKFVEKCGKGLLALIDGDDDADLKWRRVGHELGHERWGSVVRHVVSLDGAGFK